MIVACDLHLHSRFSLATSPRLDLLSLSDTAQRKGIDLLAAPDFTHPVWRKEMKEQMVETSAGSGVFSAFGASFVLVTEVSCIWRQDGRSRRVHLLVLAPDFDTVDRMCSDFAKLQNLESDGRPMFKISARDLFHLVREANPRCEIIPAHVFTPWYGVFGTKSGFDTLEECFGDMAREIFAVETGLSSDPAMNWPVQDAAERAILSFSDAHSAQTMGRELTNVQLDEISFDALVGAIRDNRIASTYEFHPEHGKYHLDGHRKCGVRMSPSGSARHGSRCPECGRPLTLGVLNRTTELATHAYREPVVNECGELSDPAGIHPPYRRLIPLRELIAHAMGVGVNTKTVATIREQLVRRCGNEMSALVDASFEDLVSASGVDEVARAVIAGRTNDVTIDPGYDGVYGSAIPNSPVVKSRTSLTRT